VSAGAAARFGRVLAAYRGIFVAGSLVWGVVLTAFVRIGSIWRVPPFAWSVSR
jgi:drug/metabolite transporter superfamily protein YnfA